MQFLSSRKKSLILSSLSVVATATILAFSPSPAEASDAHLGRSDEGYAYNVRRGMYEQEGGAKEHVRMGRYMKESETPPDCGCDRKPAEDAAVEKAVFSSGDSNFLSTESHVVASSRRGSIYINDRSGSFVFKCGENNGYREDKCIEVSSDDNDDAALRYSQRLKSL